MSDERAPSHVKNTNRGVSDCRDSIVQSFLDEAAKEDYRTFCCNMYIFGKETYASMLMNEEVIFNERTQFFVDQLVKHPDDPTRKEVVKKIWEEVEKMIESLSNN